MSYTFKKIEFKIVSKKYDKKTQVSIKNSLIYIMWPNARIYWFLDKPNDINKTINFDDANKTFKFSYIGKWEIKDKEIDVNKPCKIIFKIQSEYLKFKTSVNKFINITKNNKKI